LSNYFALTRHPVTGGIEMASWLDDYDGKRRYGVRFPSDGSIHGGKDCTEVSSFEAAAEINRLRAVLRDFFASGDFDVVTTGDEVATQAWIQRARAELEGKTDG
jgi:hypothetical protein